MKFEFKYELSVDELSKLIHWYYHVENKTIEQHPLWRRSTESGCSICYFIASENDSILCSAVITETAILKTKLATIDFGPLFSDNQALIESIGSIYKNYKEKGFTALTIQLAMPTGSTADYIEYSINKLLPVRYYFDRNNWSSTVIDLTNSQDDLLKRMSKGHRSDIKKAIKSELSVSDSFTDKEFNEFIEIYKLMHTRRGLAENNQGSKIFLEKIYKFFKDHNTGKIFIVKDREANVLGGILIVHQGKIARYFKGAANPDIKNLPILHMAIWEAMITSKQNGFESFDLWGYNHFVNEGDQVFNINRFKKGFGGEFTFYPKKMYFIFKPWQYKMYNVARSLKKKIKKM